MKLRASPAAGQRALASGSRGALLLVGGRHNYVGVSLQEILATMQVMLVSLRAKWDATLVNPFYTNYDRCGSYPFYTNYDRCRSSPLYPNYDFCRSWQRSFKLVRDELTSC